MDNPTQPKYGLPLNGFANKHKAEIIRIESIVLTRANCTLAWKIFSDWNLSPKFSNVYGKKVEWHGAPWETGSRMIIDIIRPVSAKVDRVITVCTPPHCVAWISHVHGYTMEQWVVFDPYTGGGAKVTTWIELTGPALCGEKHDMKKLMQSFIDDWFHNFSAECDRVAKGY